VALAHLPDSTDRSAGGPERCRNTRRVHRGVGIEPHEFTLALRSPAEHLLNVGGFVRPQNVADCRWLCGKGREMGHQAAMLQMLVDGHDPFGTLRVTRDHRVLRKQGVVAIPHGGQRIPHAALPRLEPVWRNPAERSAQIGGTGGCVEGTRNRSGGTADSSGDSGARLGFKTSDPGRPP